MIDAKGRVLIAQRPPGKHLAGGWEFPGGKLEPGEERVAGLARELQEELGITLVGIPRPLIRVRHTYPTREVLLDMWVVKRYAGEPQGLDGQALRWCPEDELAAADLLPADKPIVAALRLPERLGQTSSRDYTIGDMSTLESRAGAESTHNQGLYGVLCSTVDDAVGAARMGAEFLVMSHPLRSDELVDLCRLVPVPVFARGIELEEAWALGASGLSDIAP